MISNLDTYLKLCDSISSAFDLHVFYIEPGGKIIYESPNNQSLNPLYENQKQNLFTQLNLYTRKSYDFPLIQKSAFSETFILVSVFNKDSFEGTVLIGPSIYYPLSDNRVNGIINDSLAFFNRDKVIQYYSSIPTIPHEKLLNICSIAFQLFNHVFISPETVLERNGELAEPNLKMKKTDLVISKNLQSNIYHERLFEKKMIEIIKEGRVEELTHLPTLKEEEVASVLSKTSYFRSNKNHIITLITLVSRAAIEGGLHDEVAFSLHDRFIQQLEEITTLEEIRELAKEVLYTYAEKVRQAKNERYSKTVTTCKDYIYKHIYENIAHNDIARKAELSPKYLSVLFKKEVGITVSEYIQQTKVNEAKKLLAYSKTPISEICTLLNFNDQSYFTKVFKKVTGVTPMYFRERHHLLDRK